MRTLVDPCSGCFPCFLGFGARDDVSGMLIAKYRPATVCPALPGVISMPLRSHGCLGLDDALLCRWCIFRCVQPTPLSERQEVLFPSFSVLLPLFSQGAGVRIGMVHWAWRPLRISPHLTSPHLTSPHLTSPHLTSASPSPSPSPSPSLSPTPPHLTSPHLTSPHLTSPHLTSPHLTVTSPHPALTRHMGRLELCHSGCDVEFMDVTASDHC